MVFTISERTLPIYAVHAGKYILMYDENEEQSSRFEVKVSSEEVHRRLYYSDDR